jgi:uncharacterized repeat protein (TIGR01451 family)
MLSTNKTLTTALLAGLLLGYSLSGFAVEFARPVSYPVGTSPAAVFVADLNGDGKPDLAVANSGSGDVSVLLNNGDGTYKPAVNFDAGMASPTSIEVADFNNDGSPDVAVWSRTSDASTLTVLLGNGDGTFQAPKATPLPSTVDQQTLDLAIADFNLDLKPDLAVLVHDANGGGTLRILVLVGNGDGTFQAPQQGSDVLSSDASYEYLVAGDFNSDAKPDLAVNVSRGIQILVGQGDGTFRAGPVIAPDVPEACGGFYFTDLRIADFNADGKVDVIAGSYSSGCYHPRRLSVFLGNGDGSFQAEALLSVEANVSTAGDFNGDGRPDIAYVPYVPPGGPGSPGPGDPGSAQVQLGRGDGGFSYPIPIDNPPFDFSKTDLASVVVRDLNGDKVYDLIVPDIGNNAVVVALNASPTSGADLGIPNTYYDGPWGGTSYTTDIQNEGPDNASGVTFRDTLPNTVSFVSATASQGSCTHSNGIVTCAIGSLASGFDATVSISVTMGPNAHDGTVTNTMNVTAVEPDPTPANNTAGLDTAVRTITVQTSGTGTGTVTVSPNGIVCGAVCSLHFLDPSFITLMPAASPGSTFTGWSGDCNGTAPDACNPWGVSERDFSVTATFTKTSTGGGDPGGGGGAFTLVELCAVMFLALTRAVGRLPLAGCKGARATD